MKKIIAFGIIFPLLLACATDGKNFTDADCVQISCTEIFISFFVNVKDNSGVVVPLDSFEVTDVNTGEDLTREVSTIDFQVMRQEGRYPLYDDLTDATRDNIDRVIVFKGLINKIEVVSTEFEAGRGCCHAHIEGNLDLVIDPAN